MPTPPQDWDPMESPHKGDPTEMHEKLRERCPVAWSNRFGGFYALMRFDDVTKAALDIDTYTSAQKTPIPDATGPERPPRAPVEVDPPIHTHFRDLLNRFFTPDHIRRLEPVIRRTARELLGRCISLGETDAVGSFTFFMPIRVQCILLGISVEDAEMIKNKINEVIEAASAEDTIAQKKANDEIYAYIYRVVEARRKLPHDTNDVISALIHEKVGDRMLTDEDVAGTIRLFLQAGHGTTTNSLGSILRYLGSTPEAQKRLRVEPQLIPQAIEELLRVWTPVRMVGRRTTCDVDVRGVTIPKGSKVALMVSSANRDADAFENANEVDFDRKPNRHIAFGYGVHRCVGASLARSQLRIAIEELLAMTDDFVVTGETEFSVWTHLGPAKLPMKFVPRSTEAAAVTAKSSVRELRMTIAALKPVADRIVELELRADGDAPLQEWAPGAHIDLVLPGDLFRSYSLVGDVADRRRWRIAVLRETAGRGGSAAIHKMKVGDALRVRPPRNNFPMKKASGYHFFASGIGITPILPMIEAAVEKGAPWRLDYVGRNRAALAYVDHVLRLPYARVHFTSERGRPALEGLLRQTPREFHVYACGSQNFLQGLEAAVVDAGREMHAEWFAPKPGARQGADGAHESFSVRLERSNLEINVLPGQSIIDACAEAGVAIPASCFEGTCGSCLTTVLEGVPDHRDSFLTPNERKSNKLMAACVSKSMTGKLTVDW